MPGHRLTGAKITESITGEIVISTLGFGVGHWDVDDPRIDVTEWGLPIEDELNND